MSRRSKGHDHRPEDRPFHLDDVASVGGEILADDGQAHTAAAWRSCPPGAEVSARNMKAARRWLTP